jgi:hypothetical protein
MALDELGTDFFCGPDEDGNFDITDDFASVDGATAYVQAIARRLSTDGLFYDQTYGRDIIMFIGEAMPLTAITQIVEAECMQDERTKSARWEATVQDETIEGPLHLVAHDDVVFDLTLTIDRVSSVVRAVPLDSNAPKRLQKGDR